MKKPLLVSALALSVLLSTVSGTVADAKQSDKGATIKNEQQSKEKLSSMTKYFNVYSGNAFSWSATDILLHKGKTMLLVESYKVKRANTNKSYTVPKQLKGIPFDGMQLSRAVDGLPDKFINGKAVVVKNGKNYYQNKIHSMSTVNFEKGVLVTHIGPRRPFNGSLTFFTGGDATNLIGTAFASNNRGMAYKNVYNTTVNLLNQSKTGTKHTYVFKDGLLQGVYKVKDNLKNLNMQTGK